LPHNPHERSHHRTERAVPAPDVQGRSIVAVAAVEPNAGSDASAVETTALLDGNEWIINGTKISSRPGEWQMS